jgi:hypothetical protein
MVDRFPPDKSEAMTAVGMVVRVHAGRGNTEAWQKGVHLCLRRLPKWDVAGGSIDMYYWFWGTMALRQAGPAAFSAWRRPLEGILLSKQRRDGHLAGSFDPLGPWGRDGGRVYATALMTMCAEMADTTPRPVKKRVTPEVGDMPTPK